MRKSRAQIYDELLVLKCQAGEKDAFEELVKRWEKRLWYYAFRVTCSEPAAWDILQETWLAIIKGIRKLEDVAVFPKWAFRIASNKCTDWLRRQHLQSRFESEFLEQMQNESDVAQNIDNKTELLRSAVAKLSFNQRAMLMLRYNEGFEIAQIADILSIPEGTVKSRIHRAINQLRQMVEHQKND